MPGSWAPAEFPNLDSSNHTITSPADRRYNCTAWAAGDSKRKWWPDRHNIGYWPAGVPREETLDAFFRAYGTLGFRPCFSGTLEADVEKIAVYATRNADGTFTPTHAALQLPTGEWTSKLGDFEDISHQTADAVFGPVYGDAIYYLCRPKNRP